MGVTVDYLIVGSGLTGATLSRAIHDRGYSVLVLDRRNHIGGNVHDNKHKSGISIHTYGPHYFRTNDEELWNYVNQFSRFYKYEPCLKSFVDGQYENWPIAQSYIKKYIGELWTPENTETPRNFEEACLSIMPRLIYEKFVKGYTEKQWGVLANSLDANLAKRFDVRSDDEPRLLRHKYQGIPIDGYAKFMENMLDGIEVVLNTDYLKERDKYKARRMIIFTGPIDEFFGFDLGRLQYRGQKREDRFYDNVNFLQPCGQVNNPSINNGKHIRTLEWKHMMPLDTISKISGTIVTKEFPYSPTDSNNYEYPFPNRENQILFEKYKSRLNQLTNIMICGRLGEYKYYDMDQTIARAQMLTKKILSEN